MKTLVRVKSTKFLQNKKRGPWTEPWEQREFKGKVEKHRKEYDQEGRGKSGANYEL